MPFGHHLRAHQYVNVTTVHGGQVCIKLAFAFGGVGIKAANAQRTTVAMGGGGEHVSNQLFELLCTAPHCLYIYVTATGASRRYAFRKTAVMTA